MLSRFNRLFCFVAISILFFLAPASSASTQVALEWSQNSEPDLAGYKAYTREEGQLYDYTSPSWEGTETTCIIYNLSDTVINYFVVRAFDIEGFESSDSNEVFLEPDPIVEIDNVFITSASYNVKKKTLLVEAVSDAPAGSVTLTVYADFGTGSVELGNLKYSVRKRTYSNTFRKISAPPNMVIITSSGGGYDDKDM